MNSFDSTNYITFLTRELLKQKEAIISEQLCELIKRDLIVIEETQPVVIRTEGPNGPEFKLQQSVRLVPKEFDYIKKLEAENKELKEILTGLQDAIRKITF